MGDYRLSQYRLLFYFSQYAAIVRRHIGRLHNTVLLETFSAVRKHIRMFGFAIWFWRGRNQSFRAVPIVGFCRKKKPDRDKGEEPVSVACMPLSFHTNCWQAGVGTGQRTMTEEDSTTIKCTVIFNYVFTASSPQTPPT